MDEIFLIHPHDKLFKVTFGLEPVVQSFRAVFLNEEERRLINPTTLQSVKDSHIDPEFREYFSDSVYTSVSEDGSTCTYLLFEHKSYTDHHIGIQLLQNITMILHEHSRQHKAAIQPAIIAVVICQNTSGWITHNRETYSLEPFAPLRKDFPQLKMNFLNLSLIADSHIKGHPYLRILFLTFKYIRSPEMVHKIGDIIVIFKEADGFSNVAEYFKEFILYLKAAASKEVLSELQLILRELLMEEEEKWPDVLREMFSNIYEEGFAEGKAKGEAKGEAEDKREIALKMISENYDSETISRITGLPEKEIEKLRRKKPDSESQNQ
ncbi:MAG: Rpn family recombination-promoting nuclease/putative transposase [Chitinispirillaceae bacterium]